MSLVTKHRNKQQQTTYATKLSSEDATSGDYSDTIIHEIKTPRLCKHAN